MPSLSSISDPKVYHILTYGTLLGSNIQNTFFAGPIAYSCLPRPQFATLQTKIFPVFFSFQSVLPLILAATFPGPSSTALKSPENDTGMRGLLMEHNFWSALLPISLMFATSALNLVLLGPATTRIMRKRKHQETRDGKKYYDSGPKSAEMERLNTSFGWLHGASSLANLIGMGAMVFYGIVLAEQL